MMEKLAFLALISSGIPVSARLNEKKIAVCHVNGNGGVKELRVGSQNALKAHLRHGDYLPDTFYLDSDGDGFGNRAVRHVGCLPPSNYVEDNTDCDDNNPNIHPGATETCNGIDDNCNEQVDEGVQLTFYADKDSDLCGDPKNTIKACSAPSGFVTDSTDCNDADGAVHPGATEVCNGIDDNCDGQVDENVRDTFYADADGDGYGDLGTTTEACSAPPGYVADNTDCDDRNAAVNPSAAEVCNGIDDNCDAVVDEGLEITFYADVDLDGYGNASNTLDACSAPPGYVLDDTDCDDTDDAVNPGAIEVCNEVDDNCNGEVDEGVKLTFYADADGDGYGDVINTADACTAPPGYVSDDTDCDDTQIGVNPGAAEVCNDIDDNCNGEVDEGVQLTFYADADEDGFGDPADTRKACSAPPGFVENGIDCDDSDESIYPGMPVPPSDPFVSSSTTSMTPNTGVEVTTSLETDSTSSDGSVQASIKINIGDVFQPKINVVYVIDTSGSTSASVLAQEVAALQLLTEDIDALGFPDGAVTISLVPFSTTSGPDATGDDSQTFVLDATDDTSSTDVLDIQSALDGLSAGGWTNYVGALAETERVLKNIDPAGSDTNIVYFLSDGQPTVSGGTQTEAEIMAAAAPLHAIASVNAYEIGEVNALQYLNAVDNTGGTFEVNDPTDLSSALLGSPIPEGTVSSAELVVFDDSSTVVNAIPIDVPGGLDNPSNPNLVETIFGLSLDVSVDGFNFILGAPNRLQFRVSFDDNADSITDVEQLVEVDIKGNLCPVPP